MNRGTVVLNTTTGERILFFKEQKEETEKYVRSNINNMQLLSFEKYTDEEKYETILHNFNKMVEFDNVMKGTGRSYNNRIDIGLDEMKWIISKIKI